jgi:hypothetical protein
MMKNASRNIYPEINKVVLNVVEVYLQHYLCVCVCACACVEHATCCLLCVEIADMTMAKIFVVRSGNSSLSDRKTS